ncbi:ABC transporter permease [Corynebacterium comes]|uniref:Uncharacterized protein n=1 Tax=Corynebacterium comes TaxID=2675218 RepID=A0A6B8W3B7_9CORY|nr:ABC transporter permease [Corynebacterium comes]QGU04300.1 hypothetical protein CETAM_05145 [Corynebacterium comes]
MPRTRTLINPLTALVTGLSSWILVLGVNSWRFSVAVTLVAWAVGAWRTRNCSVIATTALLAVPTALSMLLVHAPYGAERLAPLLTRDGVVTAAELTARFTALMAALLAAAAFIRVADLAKALQVSPLGPRVAYIVAAALQLLPQGRRTVGVVRDANRLAGRRIHAGNVIPRVAVPVMTQLLTANVQKSRALETAGLDLPGRRTVLRPVPDSPAQQVARVLIPVAAVVGALL